MRRSRLALLALVLAWPLTGAARADSAHPDKAGSFDFYVLSLSWSPAYCVAEGASANAQQCAAGRRYGFIVHGLWPQNADGGWPQYCPSKQPERVPTGVVSPYYDIIPSAGLAGHMWRKHGSCSGLMQGQYFALVRAAFDHVSIPQAFSQPQAAVTYAPGQVENAFRAANPGLPAEGIAVTCDRTYLREVRICLTTGLGFRACPHVDAEACRAPQVKLPPPG